MICVLYSYTHSFSTFYIGLGFTHSTGECLSNMHAPRSFDVRTIVMHDLAIDILKRIKGFSGSGNGLDNHRLGVTGMPTVTAAQRQQMSP